METTFKERLREYIKVNFNYDPAFGKELKSIPKKLEDKKSFDSLNFPKTEEIDNSFIYHALKILNEIGLKNEKNEKLLKLLSCVYLFFEETIPLEETIAELQYPFKFSKEIEKCFKNKKDYITFQVFNMALLLNKKIDDNYFQSMNFAMMNIIVLYEYIFIKINSEIELQIIIAKIISLLFQNMTKFQIDNNFVTSLNPFFFSEGETNFTQFLKPKDSSKEFVKTILLSLENKLLNIIKEDIKYYDKDTEYLFKELYSIDRVYLIEEKNKKLIDEENKLDNEINSKDNTDLSAQATRLGKDDINLTIQVKELKEDNTNLNNKVNVLNGKVRELGDENSGLKTQVEKLITNNTNLNNRVDELNGKVRENSGLKTQVEKLTTENSNLKTEVNELNDKVRENSGLKTQVEKLTTENSNLKTEVKKLTTENSNLKTEVNNLNITTAQLLKDVGDLKSIVNYREYTIKKQEEEIKKRKEEINTANKEKKDLSEKTLITFLWNFINFFNLFHKINSVFH